MNTQKVVKDKLLDTFLLVMDEFENNPLRNDETNDNLLEFLSTRFESIKKE